MQTGQSADDEVLAGFFAVDVAYEIPNHPLGLGFVGRLAAFSGGRRGDGRNETFDPLFPVGGYLNDAELFRGSNIATARLGVTVEPGPDVTARLSWDEYGRISTADGIHSIGGAPLRREVPVAGRGSSATRVGGALSADAAWQITPDIDLTLIASHFLPGRYIRETAVAKAETVDFVSIDARLRF